MQSSGIVIKCCLSVVVVVCDNCYYSYLFYVVLENKIWRWWWLYCGKTATAVITQFSLNTSRMESLMMRFKESPIDPAFSVKEYPAELSWLRSWKSRDAVWRAIGRHSFSMGQRNDFARIATAHGRDFCPARGAFRNRKIWAQGPQFWGVWWESWNFDRQ